MPTLRYALTLLLPVVALSCDGGGTGPESRIRLAVASGDGQSTLVGSPVADPLVVKVTDEAGGARPGVPVEWRVTAGGGSVTPLSAATGADGLASAAWTLGPTPGANAVTATARGVAVGFSATGVEGGGAARTLQKVSGDGQTGPAGAALPAPLIVLVTLPDGTPVPGAAVSWSVVSGGGSVSPGSSTTGTDGRAQTVWTLGPTAGQNTLTSSTASARSATFTATGS